MELWQYGSLEEFIENESPWGKQRKAALTEAAHRIDEMAFETMEDYCGGVPDFDFFGDPVHEVSFQGRDEDDE